MHGNRNLMIIGGGSLQIPVIRHAISLGFRPVVIDRNPNCAVRKWAGETDTDLVFEPVDIFDWDGALDAARAFNIRGVAAVAIDAEDTAAYVAENMDLPGPPLPAAVITRDKGLFYSRLHLELPEIPPSFEYREDSSIDDIPFDLPVIVRPVNNSASRGTMFVYSEPELAEAIGWARRHNISSMEHGAFIIISPLLPPGREFSTEIIILPGGDVVPLNSVLRPFWPRALGAPIEIGHISPAPITQAESETLFRLCKEVADLLGVDWGVVKIDTLWPDGAPTPFILEGTLRLSGGCDSTHTFEMAYGRSIVRAFLRLAMGEPVSADDPDLVGEAPNHAAAVGFTLPEGKIKMVPADSIREILGVEGIVSRFEEGDMVGPFRDCAGRAGFVLTKDSDPWEAWRKGLEAAAVLPAMFAFD